MNESIIQVVSYNKEFYLFDGKTFYGHYHSAADAESDVKSSRKKIANIPDYKLVKNIT